MPRPARRARTAAASRWRSGRRSSAPRAGSRGRSRWASSGARRLRRARSCGRGRSRPGWSVISTTIRSERTRVPPVTADRSPPDSRMTGADSPVIADSSTDAIPSTTVPSPGITCPASTMTRSPLRRLVAGTASSPFLVTRRAIVSVRPRRSAAAWALPRPSAMASAKLAKSEREPEPERDLDVEEDVLAAGDVAHEQDADQDRPDEHDEHDRVAGLEPRIELAERVADRGADDRAIEKGGASGLSHGILLRRASRPSSAVAPRWGRARRRGRRSALRRSG